MKRAGFIGSFFGVVTFVSAWRMLRRIVDRARPSMVALVEPFISEESPLDPVIEPTESCAVRPQARSATGQSA